MTFSLLVTGKSFQPNSLNQINILKDSSFTSA
jgi:hypothetical protein